MGGWCDETRSWALGDCEAALRELPDGMSASLWRRRYVSAIALLRAVGHILDRVDGSRTPELRHAIDRAYAQLKLSKPEPKIFWGFIEQERNLLLKEYRPAAVRELGAYASPLMPTEAPERPGWVKYRLIGGAFKDRDPRDVIAEAIAWWKTYLDMIDASATKQPPN